MLMKANPTRLYSIFCFICPNFVKNEVTEGLYVHQVQRDFSGLLRNQAWVQVWRAGDCDKDELVVPNRNKFLISFTVM